MNRVPSTLAIAAMLAFAMTALGCPKAAKSEAKEEPGAKTSHETEHEHDTIPKKVKLPRDVVRARRSRPRR